MTLNPQNRDFSAFFPISAATHIIKVNCVEMARDGPGQPACDILA